MSCLLALILKLYSFKFLYNFTGQLKNLKLVMLMAKSFDKLFCFFMIEIQAY